MRILIEGFMWHLNYEQTKTPPKVKMIGGLKSGMSYHKKNGWRFYFSVNRYMSVDEYLTQHCPTFAQEPMGHVEDAAQALG